MKKGWNLLLALVLILGTAAFAGGCSGEMMDDKKMEEEQMKDDGMMKDKGMDGQESDGMKMDEQNGDK